VIRGKTVNSVDQTGDREGGVSVAELPMEPHGECLRRGGGEEEE
jgi:hypothetical protein